LVEPAHLGLTPVDTPGWINFAPSGGEGWDEPLPYVQNV
jgi:hypothetical protein